MRRIFMSAVFMILAIEAAAAFLYPPLLWSLVLFGPLIVVGLYDYYQKPSAVLRNFPLLGHFRYMLESIRPEISQYFIETETSGRPFGREERSVVYQRAKGVRDTVPFGTIRDLYEVGYEWINHSLKPLEVDARSMRVTVGGPDCKMPYSSSILNISAMSFGSLSSNAILALNHGAREGRFAHNTGEGGLSLYHTEPGGDLIWQIGTAYFGCRTEEGRFDAPAFADKATHPNVKMIEIKLSQGAKPGHGGILPAVKVTPEISSIRMVPMGKDVLSPPYHSAFSTPVELMEFINTLRERSGGKPVGFKLCVGKRREFMAICKAMVKTGISPDFITVDGGEGGTGAAPLEFANRVGAPLIESLIFVHTTLVGFSLREKIRVVASGRVLTGFHLIKRLALGADMCNSARAMMMALGCIQARRCNSNLGPVGVATQDPELTEGLVVSDKGKRIKNFHEETMVATAELVGAMGLTGPGRLRPWHIMRRTAPNEIRHYAELYDSYSLANGDLLAEPIPEFYRRAWGAATAESFENRLDPESSAVVSV